MGVIKGAANELEQKIMTFTKNQKHLGFTVLCNRKGSEIKISIANIEDRYQEAVTKLAYEIYELTVNMVCYITAPGYILSPDDEKSERERIRQLVDEHIDTLFSTLLTHGYKLFFNNVFEIQKTLETRYMLGKMSLDNGVWVFPDGSFWDGEDLVKIERGQRKKVFGVTNDVLKAILKK